MVLVLLSGEGLTLRGPTAVSEPCPEDMQVQPDTCSPATEPRLSVTGDANGSPLPYPISRENWDPNSWDQRLHSEPNLLSKADWSPGLSNNPGKVPEATWKLQERPQVSLFVPEKALPVGPQKGVPRGPALPAWEISTSVSAGQKGLGPQLHRPKTQSAETPRQGLGAPLVPHDSPRNVTRCQEHRGRERTDPAWPPSLPRLVGDRTTGI